MKSIFLFLIVAFNSSLIFSQNQIETEAQITGVTVYSSSAEIKYSKDVAIKKGKNTIVFSNLSPFIVENSINLNVSDKSVNIVTVSDKINYLKISKNERISNLKSKIEENTLKIEKIENKCEVLEKEKTLLFKDKGIDGVASGVLVSEIEKASIFFNKRYSELNDQLFNLNQEKNKLLTENKSYNLQMTEETTSSEEKISEITVVLNAPGNSNVTINFSFLTYNSGWAPLYDLKFTGHNQALGFEFRANVFNASNTDWNNVKIKLSTASPTVGFALPTLSENSTKNKSVNYKNEDIKFKTIETNNVITEYNIAYEYSIPSDGKPYLVDVDKYSMPASFSYIIIPKLDKNGFLMANIPNWNNYNLISGATNIYNNGTFLGKTFLNTNTDNDTLKVYLGKDNKIEAYRKEVNIEHPRKFVGNYFVDKTFVSFTIKNNYENDVKLELIDQVPVFNERDKVKMDINGIDNAEYNTEDGALTWAFIIKSKETIERDFDYNIKAAKENGELVQMKRKKFRTISCPTF